MSPLLKRLICTILLIWSYAHDASALEVTRAADTIHVQLSQHVSLHFTVDGEHLLGLTSAEVNGIKTTASDTAFRPYLAEDMFGEPIFTHALRLKEVQENDRSVTFILETRASSDMAALKRFYNMAPDEEAITEDAQLEALRRAAEQAQEKLDAYVISKDKNAQKHHQLLSKQLAAAEAAMHKNARCSSCARPTIAVTLPNVSNGR